MTGGGLVELAGIEPATFRLQVRTEKKDTRE
jgi:hypothetical protein